MKIAIIAADFNEGVVGAMIKAAEAEIAKLNGSLVDTVRVPGAYEIPLAAKTTLEKGQVDGLVVLGFIEKGETLHGEVMGQVVHEALIKLQLEFGKPMGLAVIGPGATEEQAEARKIEYAQAGVRAVFKYV